MAARGHGVAREVGVRIMYKGDELGVQRLDMIVDHKLVIEVKSTAQLHKDAGRQVYNYLRASNLEVGLLLHFGPKPAFYTQICPNDRTLRGSGSPRLGMARQSTAKTNALNERIHESSEG